MAIQVIKVQSHAFMLNGKTHPAEVTIEVERQHTPPRWHIPIAEANSLYEKLFKRGALKNYCVTVTAHWDGIEAKDWIYDCHLRPLHLDEDVLEVVMKNKMVEGVLDELTSRLAGILNKLS